MQVQKTENAMTARKNFGRIMEEAHYRGDEIVVERAGKPMVVIISYAEFQEYKQQREKDFEILNQIRAKNQNVNPVEVETAVETAIAEIRKG
jgi:prevent-host-death family protein